MSKGYLPEPRSPDEMTAQIPLYSFTYQSTYGSGHEGVAVLLPGFAISW